MGGAQSAQREDKKDSTAEEESGKVDDAQAEQHIEDKPLKNNGQISEINGKVDGTIAEDNGHCEDEIAAEAILSGNEDVSEAEKPLKEETPLENVKINEKESPDEADANEEAPLEMIEMDAKQNDINESFKRFFSNINVKLTVKRGSAEKADIAADMPDVTTKEESNRPEDAEDTAKENKSEDVQHNTDLNAAQEAYHHDSTCPSLTDIASEGVLQNAEEKTIETKEDVYSNNAGQTTTTLSVGEGEKVQQDATPEEDVVVSPIKRFFTTGIFSGLRKKKKLAEDETTDKELVDMRTMEAVETTEQTEEVQQHDKEISLGVDAVTAETEHKENGLKEEILSAASAQMTDEGKSSSKDPSTIIVNEPEILSSQEKDKVQASPLKRLLSGSSLKKSSKKQRDRKSSDAKLSDSGEHVSNQLLSSTDETDTAGEEDGAWASFKKLVTPKKRMKRSSLTNEETQIPSSVQESKPSEGEQISDHSTEEGKKRKDSSVSWEAVLCGSGRRRSRSRKTSDSDDEKPQVESDDNKQGSPLESSNEVDENLSYYPKQTGSPSEGDGGSTWKSFKKLVTPKKKAKDEDENHDNIQSDGEVNQDDSSFSIKKLLPGRKKRKPAEKQDHVSSDEADKEATSGDEDSETPAVVPLSEFDTAETEAHLQTHADIESHVLKEPDYEVQQDLLDKMAEPVLPCDSLQTEAKKVEDNEDALKNETSAAPASNEEPDDFTEVISKHQQLSDIPEEGIITETMATPASATEEPARDDTIADDLLEITSEAITAPEPVDITLADETEMISAVSQLSESSKTSGNTTPVPAEYDIKDTEVLLQQVVENISISPKGLPLCSDEIRSERIVASVSRQILETFVKQEPTILEIHKRSDATAINTGLNVKELDAINKLAATAQTESISEVNEAVSIEIVSEVLTEEFDTAEIAVDEIHDVSITHLEESIKELESTDNQDLVECQSEVNEAMSTEILPKSEEIVAEECSLVEAHQAENMTLKTDIQETETKDGGVEQEVQTVLETNDEIMQNITDQVQAEHQDQPAVVEQELQVLAIVEAATLNSEEDIVQSPEKEVTSADIPAVETVTDEPKEEIEALTAVNVKSKKEDEPQTDAAKTEHGQVPEVLGAEQTAATDLEMGSIETSEKEVPFSDDILPAEAVTDEPKEKTECLIEVSVEPENKEPLVDPPILEHHQVTVVLEPVQVPFKKDVISEAAPGAETVTDEPKEEKELLTEVNVEEDELQADTAKTEHVQGSEALGGVQATALYLQIGSIQTPEKEVPLLEDIPPEEPVTDELKEETEPVTEVNVEPEKEDELQGDAAKHGQVPEVLAIQAAALDSEMSSIQIPDKDIPLLQDTPPAETVTDEPKEETKPLTEVHVEPKKEEELQADAAKIKHVQVSEVLRDVQAAELASEMGSIEAPVKDVPLLEDIPPAEPITRELKLETEPVAEVSVEHEKEDELQADAAKIEHGQVVTVHAGTLDSELSSIQTPEKEIPLSEDIPPEEPVTDELKEETEPITEVNVELETEDELQADAAKIEYSQVPEVLAVQAAASDSLIGIIQTPEKDIPLPVEIPPAEPITCELKEETEAITEVNVEHEKEDDLQADAAKIEYRQVVAVQADSKTGSIQTPEKDIPLLEDIPTEETVSDEPKEETKPLTKVNVELEMEDELQADAAKTKHVQVSEVLGGVQAAALDSEMSSIQTPEKDIPLSEEISPAVTCELKEETEPVTEVNVELETEDELQADAAKIEYSQVPEVLAVQAAASDSLIGIIQTPEKDIPLSVEIPPAEPVTCELKEETKPVAEVSVEHEKEDELQVYSAKIEQVLAVQETETETKDEGVEQKVQTALVTKDEIMQDITDQVQAEHQDHPAVVEQELQALATVEAATLNSDEPKEETEPLTAVNVISEKEDEPQADAAKTEHGQVQKVSAVQAAALHSQMVRIPEKDVPLPEDIPPEETVTDEPKKTKDRLTGVSAEPENKELDASIMEHHQVTVVLEPVQVPTLDLEEGIVHPFEKDVISEAAPGAETVTDEPKEEKDLLTEVDAEPMDASKTQHIQKPEVLEAVQVAKLDSEVSTSVPLEMDVISQASEGTTEPEEELPVENAKTENVQESEVLPCDVKDTVTERESEEESSMSGHVTESTEGVCAQENAKQVLLEDVHNPDDYAIASVADSEAVAEMNQALESNEYQTTESIPKDVQVEQEDRIPETVDELQTLSAVCVSSVIKDTSSAQMLEKKVISEETPVPCVDNATSTYEPKHAVHLSEVQSSIEGEKEGKLPCAEIKTPVAEHAVVAQIITCNLKEVSAVIPDVLIEKTSDIHEPLIDIVASLLEFKEEVETATPVVKGDITETAKEGSLVVMMHVSSAELEDNHRIQVQVVDVDTKSAKMTADSLLDIGVTEANEVIDICHETLKEIDKLLATEEMEEEVINKENKVIIQEVGQHVKENLPERGVVQPNIQDEVVNLEQEHVKQPDDVTEVSEMAEIESNEVENQKVMGDTSGTFSQRQDEAPIISDDSATERQVSEDLVQPPNIPGGLDVSIHDHKEDLEEHKAELDKCEAGVTVEEVKLSSEELDMNEVNEEAQISHISQSEIVMASNTGLEVPQNTGIISSMGNLESPSSLSLEFKLNIQFGQAKAPASPPAATERTKASPPAATERPVTDVSEVGVQTVEPQEPINATLRAESKTKTVLTEVSVQATEIKEPKRANLDPTERALIMNQPVLLDISIQAMEPVQPAEQIKSTESVAPNVQATETTQPVMQTEKREVIQSQPVLYAACYEETKVEEPVKQIEDENDQDLWMDAQEDIYTQEETKVSIVKVEEPVEHQTESDQEEKTGLEHEFEMAPEMAPKSKTNEEEISQQEIYKKGETCETENEYEEFAVALENPETSSTAVMEWD